MNEKRALVLAGDGINCEVETAEAFGLVGFQVDLRHINDLIREKLTLDKLSSTYACLALPGGFSFGDDIASGTILALKIQHRLEWDLAEYCKRGGMVLGICNGFQALIRLGLFGKYVSITKNISGKFQNRWVSVSPRGQRCVWLKGMGSFLLPIRHAEGRVMMDPGNQNEVWSKMQRQGMSCLIYDGENPNGSDEGLAGLCDSSGRIFGLMPHPEAYVRWTQHPSWTRQRNRAGAPGEGLTLFENAFREVS